MSSKTGSMMRLKDKSCTSHISLLFVVLCLLMIFDLPCPPSEVFAEEVELSMEEISYTTADEVTIYGSWVVPQSKNKKPSKKKKSSKAPVVILLHDYGFDRRDWGIFIPDLVKHGYNVLAIDMRGHGKSTEGGLRLSGKYSARTASYVLQSGYLDVQAALKWLERREDTDNKKIFVVGVGLGADIAYFCSGKFTKKIRSTVVISPSLSAVSEGAFTKANPKTILFCASSRDANGSSMIAAESLSNFTKDPKKLVIYESAAHGLSMFYKHPEIRQEILGWLR